MGANHNLQIHPTEINSHPQKNTLNINVHKKREHLSPNESTDFNMSIY